LIFKNAAALRNNLTPVEMLLWGHLKGSQLGAKFRRQHPLGIYIADFYCHEHKIVIELDGSIHNLPEIAKNDIERQLNIENDGIIVLRFKNEEIFNQLEKVLNTIKETISSPASWRGGLSKRIIPCLDIKDGRTVKGVNFVDLRDAGDPVELAWNYSRQGADELVFLDITALLSAGKQWLNW